MIGWEFSGVTCSCCSYGKLLLQHSAVAQKVSEFSQNAVKCNILFDTLSAWMTFNRQANAPLELHVGPSHSCVGCDGWLLVMALAWFMEKPAFFLETGRSFILEQSNYYLQYSTPVCVGLYVSVFSRAREYVKKKKSKWPPPLWLVLVNQWAWVIN